MKSNNIDTIYRKLIKSVLEEGQQNAQPRGRKVRELYNVLFTLEDARNSIIQNGLRKMNYAYAAIEMLGLFRPGWKNVEPYSWYNSVMKSFINPDTGRWDGSYAERICSYSQMHKMFEILSKDPDSRRAVIAFYNPRHDFHQYESKDICCTLSLVFRVRDGKLHLTCTMRATDILLGLPYDLTQFTFLQSVLAKWLGLEVGEYTHFTANLHAYEGDWEKLQLIEKAPVACTPLTSMPSWDIPGIEDTYREIENFFDLDRLSRHYPKEINDLPSFMFGGKLRSRTLQQLFRAVTWPYIERKHRKIEKLS